MWDHWINGLVFVSCWPDFIQQPGSFIINLHKIKPNLTIPWWGPTQGPVLGISQAMKNHILLTRLENWNISTFHPSIGGDNWRIKCVWSPLANSAGWFILSRSAAWPEESCIPVPWVWCPVRQLCYVNITIRLAPHPHYGGEALNQHRWY